MQYFRYDGEWRYTGGKAGRVQVTITDLQTGQTHMPVITNKNKAYNKFINHSKWVGQTQVGFHFTCVYRAGLWVQGLHKVQVYLDKDEFSGKFAEHLV
jgi:hypothetical protein